MYPTISAENCNILDVSTMHIEELRKDPPQLQIAEYPIRKMLDIK